MTLYGLLIIFKVRQNHPDFVVPVVAYCSVISAMLVTSINYEYARTNQIPFAGRRNKDVFIEELVLGSILFYISDSILCWNKFILRRKIPEFLVLATYYPAQACILKGTVL